MRQVHGERDTGCYVSIPLSKFGYKIPRGPEARKNKLECKSESCPATTTLMKRSRTCAEQGREDHSQLIWFWQAANSINNYRSRNAVHR